MKLLSLFKIFSDSHICMTITFVFDFLDIIVLNSIISFLLSRFDHMDKHIHPSVVPYGYLVSIREKWMLNICLQEEICQYLTDLPKKKVYLWHYWYDLKYLTQALHADMDLEVYGCLVKVIDVQIGIMGVLVSQGSVPKVYDTISLKLHRVIKFMDVILYHKERNSNHFLNGLPHKFEFIMWLCDENIWDYQPM